MVRAARERFGDRPFTHEKTDSGWEAKTFAQVFDDARAFAAFLLDAKLAKGDRVAIYSEGCANWIIGEYGTIMAACVAVPLSFKLLPEEIAYRIEHSEAKVILTNSNHAEKIRSVAASVSARTGTAISIILLDEPKTVSATLPTMKALLADIRLRLSNYEQMLNSIETQASESDVVTISYTSGTTGNPKGIMLSHGNYWINSQDSVVMFQIPVARYRDFVVLPVDHSFAQTVGIHASVQRGIQIWFVDARGGGISILRNIPGNLREAEPDFMMSVPALTSNFMKKIKDGVAQKGQVVKYLFDLGIDSGIRFLGDRSRPKLSPRSLFSGLLYAAIKPLILDAVRKQVFGPRIKFITGGGASFDLGQQRFFRALGLPLYQGYGMTEASPVISTNIGKRVKLGTSGVALPHVSIRIVRDDGTIAEPGEKGEIQVRGPNVMVGYFKNPEATAETIVDGWLKTGDLGTLDAEGFLTVEGRAKALLISSDGEKYSPEGIESAILDAGKLVNQVVVYNDHRKFTCALVTLDEDAVRKAVAAGRAADAASVLELVKESFYAFKADPTYRKTVPLNWTPATFQIVEEAFSESNGLVNSTLKIVRYKVIEAYGELIEYIYSGEGSHYTNDRNRRAMEKFLKK